MKIRSFIAINLSDTIKENLKKIGNEFKKALVKSRVSWVKSDNFHITLRFLGDITEKDVVKIENILSNFVSGHKSFKLIFNKIGIFPGIKKPRVLWIGGEYPDPLKDLYRDFDSQISEIGFYEDKPFVPHITLARIKYMEKRELNYLKEKIEHIKFNYEDLITHIDLMKSQLTPQGAIYSVIKSFYLK